MKNVAKERAELVIEEIRTVLWDGSFEVCNYLLDSLHDRNIKLSEVDHYFRPIEEDLPEQLQKLSTGVHNCINPGKSTDFKWIGDVVQHVKDYWSLLTLSEEAKAVIVLKTKLSLTGSFTAIEALTDQVYSIIPSNLATLGVNQSILIRGVASEFIHTSY